MTCYFCGGTVITRYAAGHTAMAPDIEMRIWDGWPAEISQDGETIRFKSNSEYAHPACLETARRLFAAMQSPQNPASSQTGAQAQK